MTTEVTLKGIVTRTDGQRIWVSAGDAEFPCILRGRLKQDRQFVSTLAVIGDRVVVRPGSDGIGTIEELAARHSELARRVHFDQKWGRNHIMAANLDLLVNIQSAREPKFEPVLAQRFLALAHHGGIPGAIVINKCDLADDAALLQAAEAVRPFGVPVILTSTVSGCGLDELRALLQGKLVAFVGRSGAGKSSLINALFPGLDIRTREVGDRTGKGRHTTTASRLYPVPGGGYIADTPGLKDLFVQDASDTIMGTFPDIHELAAGCRFSDCRHYREPGCAVRAAVESGGLPEERYLAYLGALREDDLMKQIAAAHKTELLEGIVVRAEGLFHWVNVNGAEVCCVLRGRLKKEQQQKTRLVTAGDRVMIALQPDGGGTIEKICRRTSELVRPGFRGEEHVMAANIDQVVIVQATRTPPFEPHLVERFIALANSGRMGALVVINKLDLCDRDAVRPEGPPREPTMERRKPRRGAAPAELPAEVQGWVQGLRPFEIPVICTSAVTGEGLPELRQLLSGRISALAGRSGVGKSSLINALYPGFAIRTSVVGGRTEKGQHTTTSSSLYALPDGGYLADTPGIKELSLFVDDYAVVNTFPEIAELASGCRYDNCTHTHEPGCAVKAALDRGEIDEEYYRGYVKLMRTQRR